MNTQGTVSPGKGAAMTRTEPVHTGARSATTIRAVQVAAVLSVLTLLWQFSTAGRYLSQGTGYDLHKYGALAVHGATLLLVAATFLHARAGGPRWPVVVSALVFACTFVQAAVGHAQNLSAHVPGALVLTVGTVWVTSWAFQRHPSA
jgi:cytochrome bd-type quinol oxidase subunit 2